MIAAAYVHAVHSAWGPVITWLFYAAIVAVVVFGYRWLRKAWRYYKFGRDHQV